MADEGLMIATAVLLKVSGLLSMLGSLWIIVEVGSDREKWAMPFHRIMMGLSITDFISALGFFLSSWPVPKGLWWGALGNRTTCTVQGVLIHFSFLVAAYNVSLALYYLLVIKFGWRQKQISNSVERWLHAATWLVGLGVCIAAVASNLYIPSGPLCALSFKTNSTVIPAVVWRTTTLVTITVCMVLIYCSIRGQEDQMGRYSFTRQVSRRKSKEFATQGMLFIGAFLFTYIFQIINMVMRGTNTRMPPFLVILLCIFYPMQGLFNFFIYLRPRYMEYRKKHPNLAARQVIKLVLRRPFASYLGGRNGSQSDARLVALITCIDTTERPSTNPISSKRIAEEIIVDEFVEDIACDETKSKQEHAPVKTDEDPLSITVVAG